MNPTEGMCYNDGGRLFPLPAWAQWFTEMGEWLAMQPAAGGCLVLGVTVPTRAFAAAFTAFGLIRSRASLPLGDDLLRQHIDHLRSLPLGSGITYRRGQKRHFGSFLGFRVTGGDERIGVDLGGKGDDRVWALVSDAELFEPDEESGSANGVRLRSRGIRASGFLKACCGGDSTLCKNLLTRSRDDCILVGPQNSLKEEIDEPHFACGNERGALREVVRAGCLLGKGEARRCELHPASKEPEQTEHPPFAAIFDGSTAYLRWRDWWPESHAVAILNHTDQDFADAVHEFSREYAYRVDDGEPPTLPMPPSALWVSLFRRQVL